MSDTQKSVDKPVEVNQLEEAASETPIDESNKTNSEEKLELAEDKKKKKTKAVKDIPVSEEEEKEVNKEDETKKEDDDPMAEVKEEKIDEPAVGEEKTDQSVSEEDKEVKTKKTTAKEDESEKEETSLEDFDWEELETKGFGEGYSEKESNQLTKLYEDTLNTITEREVLTATVVGISDRDVILNIGFKSDGLVSASEFRDMPDLKVGDEVEVYVEEQENAQGQLVLSRRKAKIVQAWEKIKESEANDLVIEGMVKRRTKGGLIVDIFGVESFLPGSQIDVKPIRDFDVFVGKSMEVKVVKINYANDNVVVSHKVLIEKDLEAQRAEILNNLEKGQVLEGVIKNMTNFGVFIDLGGVDGLLHITDISWGRINHPEDVLTLDDTVKVVVLDFDEDKKRISLGMKQLTEHPWDSLDEKIEVGSKVKGKIVNVADYGAFLEIQPGVEGLIHVSEMSWSQHLRNPSDFMEAGQEMEAVVLTLDREEHKMSLGIKQLTEDPWTKADVVQRYAIGTKHKGVVRNLTNFGLFIELEEGIDGLIHVSDLSWTKKIKHPSEFISVGEELEVQVLELDAENRRLALGHKQLEENPWDTFETVFIPGSVHKCTVVSITDKGATLELPYGIEGYCTGKNLIKEEGTKPEIGESLDFKVVDFSKGEKRILMSHTAIYREMEHKPKSSKKKSSVKNQEATSSLGDIAALTDLKEQMDTGKSKAPVPKKETKAKAPKTAKKEEKPAEEIKDEMVVQSSPKKEKKAASTVKKEPESAKAETAQEEEQVTADAEGQPSVTKTVKKKAEPKAKKTAAKSKKKEESSDKEEN